MSLKPAVSLILGNLKYESHAIQARVTLGLLPQINNARVTLPLPVEVSAQPGDEAILDMDGGEGNKTVLTGRMQQLQHAFHQVTAVLVDAGGVLAQFRPAVTYEQQDAAAVIQALGGDAGIEVETAGIDLPLAAYVAHQGRTAAGHVAYLTNLAGGIAHVNDSGRLVVVQRPSGQADVALLYGRELVGYTSSDGLAPTAQRVMAGNGPAGNVSAPDALRPSAGLLPANAPTPGADAIWQATPLLRTPNAALTAMQGANMAIAAAKTTLQAHGFLLPSLRPGMVVQVQELPDPLPDGPWLLTQVTHLFRPGQGGQTQFSAVLADTAAFGLGDLLAAGLSAVGGLL